MYLLLASNTVVSQYAVFSHTKEEVIPSMLLFCGAHICIFDDVIL